MIAQTRGLACIPAASQLNVVNEPGRTTARRTTGSHWVQALGWRDADVHPGSRSIPSPQGSWGAGERFAYFHMVATPKLAAISPRPMRKFQLPKLAMKGIMPPAM